MRLKNLCRSFPAKKKPFCLLTEGLSTKRDPAGIRTLDPLLKREMLYQLSYGIVCFEGAKLRLPQFFPKVSTYNW